MNNKMHKEHYLSLVTFFKGHKNALYCCQNWFLPDFFYVCAFRLFLLLLKQLTHFLVRCQFDGLQIVDTNFVCRKGKRNWVQMASAWYNRSFEVGHCGYIGLMKNIWTSGCHSECLIERRGRKKNRIFFPSYMSYSFTFVTRLWHSIMVFNKVNGFIPIWFFSSPESDIKIKLNLNHIVEMIYRFLTFII